MNTRKRSEVEFGTKKWTEDGHVSFLCTYRKKTLSNLTSKFPELAAALLKTPIPDRMSGCNDEELAAFLDLGEHIMAFVLQEHKRRQGWKEIDGLGFKNKLKKLLGVEDWLALSGARDVGRCFDHVRVYRNTEGEYMLTSEPYSFQVNEYVILHNKLLMAGWSIEMGPKSAYYPCRTTMIRIYNKPPKHAEMFVG